MTKLHPDFNNNFSHKVKMFPIIMAVCYFGKPLFGKQLFGTKRFSKLNLWLNGSIQFEAASNLSKPFSNLARFHEFDLVDILRMITSSFPIFSFI